MTSPNVYVDTISEARGTSHGSLRGKVVLLTGIGQSGGSSMWGNGAATARILAANGCKIFGCDLQLERAEVTAQRIRAEGGEVSVTACDVTKNEAVEQLVQACIDKYGVIDILVNNVGMSEKGGPGDMTEQVWDAQMDVNLKSVYLCSHEVLPHMERQSSGGSVINIASIAALRYIGKPQIGYAAAKAAVIQYTRASAVIYAPKRIRFNVVVPGLIDTPLVAMLADKYAGGDVEGFRKTRE